MSRLNLFILILICVCLCFSMVSCDESSDDLGNAQSNGNSASNDLDEKEELPEKLKESYMITFYAEEIENNSVGEDWSYGVKFGTKEIEPGEVVTIDEDEILSFVVFVSEYDAGSPDYTEMTVIFEDMEIDSEATQVLEVTVTEKGGSYSGNTAIWEFGITCKRIPLDQ